jgi:large exoprotein involved in heme utilization and adhesion
VPSQQAQHLLGIAIPTGPLTANNGTIATSSEQSSRGRISITASNIRLFNNSDITSRVNSGVGGGGNVDIKAGSIAVGSVPHLACKAVKGT